jgi:uncharacterized protein
MKRGSRAALAWLTRLAGFVLVALAIATTVSAQLPEVLVVTVTKGFRHDSIPAAEDAFVAIAAESGRFTVDFARTDDDLASKMSPGELGRWRVVVFANTTGDLPLPDRDAFLGWVARGGSFLGAHSAADTFHGHPPYLEMLGAEFLTHGPMVTVRCVVEDAGHPATMHLAPAFHVFEEIYEFTRFERVRVRPLLSLDRHPQTGEPGYFPIAWWRAHGHGRVLYTALGHRSETWQSSWFRRHLSGAMEFLLAGPGRSRPVRR